MGAVFSLSLSFLFLLGHFSRVLMGACESWAAVIHYPNGSDLHPWVGTNVRLQMGASVGNWPPQTTPRGSFLCSVVGWEVGVGVKLADDGRWTVWWSRLLWHANVKCTYTYIIINKKYKSQASMLMLSSFWILLLAKQIRISGVRRVGTTLAQHWRFWHVHSKLLVLCNGCDGSGSLYF